MSELDALYLSYPSQIDALELRAAFETPLGEGVAGYEDLRVTPGSGIGVSVAAGEGYVRGDHVPRQGLYKIVNDAAKASSAFELGGLGAAHASNPRLDQIIAQVRDHEADGSGLRKWRLEALAGTATAGASLDNRDGAAPLPSSAMLLADVLVPAAASSLSASDIRDRRPFSLPLLPPVKNDRVEVPMIPLFGLTYLPGFNNASDNNKQSAAAFVLPQRVVGANRIAVGWDDQPVGDYVIGVYDASGRKIVSAIKAFDVIDRHYVAIPTTTFEAGIYYVLFGINTSSDNGAPYFGVVENGMGNAILSSASGGTTAPDTILGFSAIGDLPVPLIALAII